MELVASADTLQASLGNDKDPPSPPRVSYKLNLKGPSVTIQSASSTSLVAVHTACQALINRDCDMALTGGVSIHLPETAGYLYQEGRHRGAGRPLPRLRRPPRPASSAATAAASWCWKRLSEAPRRPRPRLRRHQGLGLQQRRLAQGELHGPQRRRPGAALQPRLRERQNRSRDRLLRRVPRHRAPPSAIRSRVGCALPGVLRPHRPQGLLRHRLAQDQHRPSRHPRRAYAA